MAKWPFVAQDDIILWHGIWTTPQLDTGYVFNNIIKVIFLMKSVLLYQYDFSV
jgi:hypothetical protein